MTTAVLLLLVAMSSIQAGAGLAKSLFPIVGAAGTTGLRLLFATLVLWAIWRPWRFRFDSVALKRIFLYGTSLGLMNLTFYFSLERIPLGLAVTLEFIGPLILSILMSRKKIDFLWVILAATGIYFVVPHPNSEASLDTLGIIFALVAGGFWALYIFFGQQAGRLLPGGIASSTGMAIAALAALPFSIIYDGPRLTNLNILPLAFLMACLSSAIPYSLEMVALKKMPTKTFGIFMSLEPALASLAGVLFLKEHLFPMQWLAIMLVMMASLGSVWTSKN